MKTILTMPSPELALLTMTGEGKPFVLNRRTMAELEALLDEVRWRWRVTCGWPPWRRALRCRR